jgi:hypothetical protein
MIFEMVIPEGTEVRTEGCRLIFFVGTTSKRKRPVEYARDLLHALLTNVERWSQSHEHLDDELPEAAKRDIVAQVSGLKSSATLDPSEQSTRTSTRTFLIEEDLCPLKRRLGALEFVIWGQCAPFGRAFR